MFFSVGHTHPQRHKYTKTVIELHKITFISLLISHESLLSTMNRSSVKDMKSLSEDKLDDVRGIILHMNELESGAYHRDFTLQEPFIGLWRKQIIEWMYAIVNFCKLRHEAVAVASYYLDTCVSKGVIVSAGDYQLAAMTALYLALKVFDSPTQRLIQLDSLVKLGNGGFDEAAVVKMEKKMLRALNWRLHPPTPDCFVQQYMQLLPADTSSATRSKIEEASLLVLEVAISRERFLSTEPSVLGFTSMLVAIEGIEELEMSMMQLHEFLFNMSAVANLDSNCPGLCEVSRQLDRSVKHLSRHKSKDSSSMIEYKHNRQSSDHGSGKPRDTSTVSPNQVIL
jgi:hypothetical protein